VVIEVAVHTDALDADQPLTQTRADAIVAYLVGKGVPKDRIVARGYGSSRPVNHCVVGVTCSDAEHAVNRRAEYKVIEVRP